MEDEMRLRKRDEMRLKCDGKIEKTRWERRRWKRYEGENGQDELKRIWRWEKIWDDRARKKLREIGEIKGQKRDETKWKQMRRWTMTKQEERKWDKRQNEKRQRKEKKRQYKTKVRRTEEMRWNEDEKRQNETRWSEDSWEKRRLK